VHTSEIKKEKKIEMGKINEILDGWGNLVKNTFGILDEQTKLIAQNRLFHCDNCKIRTINTCDPNKIIEHVKTGELVRGCGCNIAAKTLSRKSQCPAGKW
jgi:hypothetical protein